MFIPSTCKQGVSYLSQSIDREIGNPTLILQIPGIVLRNLSWTPLYLPTLLFKHLQTAFLSSIDCALWASCCIPLQHSADGMVSVPLANATQWIAFDTTVSHVISAFVSWATKKRRNTRKNTENKRLFMFNVSYRSVCTTNSRFYNSMVFVDCLVYEEWCSVCWFI